MELPMFQVDAFTTQRFGGNPAAVVVLDEWLPDALMQSIAAENNLAETAFVLPRERAAPLRWFTPTLEIDLCGHATLATARVLFDLHYPKLDALTFATKSGVLGVARKGPLLSLDFPARPGASAPVTDAIAEALGARPTLAFAARDLLAVFDTAAQIRALKPDFARIASLESFGVIATAPGDDVDFVSRFFVPKAGIDEDPATGSSHCTLVPYWADRLHKHSFTAKQLSARGGDFVCTLRGDRVEIGGGTVMFLRGTIEVD